MKLENFINLNDLIRSLPENHLFKVIFGEINNVLNINTPSKKSCFYSFNQAQAARVLPVLQPQPPHLPTVRFHRPVQANHHHQKLNLLQRPDLSLLRPVPPCPKFNHPHPPWMTPTKTLPWHLQLPYQHLFQTDILQLLHSQQEPQEVRTSDLKQQKGPRV